MAGLKESIKSFWVNKVRQNRQFAWVGVIQRGDGADECSADRVCFGIEGKLMRCLVGVFSVLVGRIARGVIGHDMWASETL
ncbi:hypothetical protein [Haladaptatus sp. DYF46]|uniref:hypothetical protein n=1 Tax=Haladaptatus sp. DYF46 TaxID=2886041 RepID=UPI001E547964|nr:hypothetical protein [Haladaptatus sp. DYF46]